MVERYQQGKLASSVVGTPGLDKSAGVVEQQIAQSADQMHASAAQGAMQDLRQSEQNFDQARNTFMYVQQQQKHLNVINQHIANEQRRLNVQFDRLDEDATLNGQVSDLQKQYASDPNSAVQAFKDQAPTWNEDFQQRYASDPKRLQMLMGGQRMAYGKALNELEGWAQKTTTDNLNAKLGLLPEQLKSQISGLNGTLDDQLKGFQQVHSATMGIYDNMRNMAQNPASKDVITTKQLQLNNAATNQFVDHLISQTPDGEEGIKHIDQVGQVVKNAAMYGIPLSPEAQKDRMKEIASVRNTQENEVVNNFKDDATLRVLDANRLKGDLINAADDPKQMANIAKQIQSRMTFLDQKIAEVAKEPDSKIKNAKLASFKQEQSSFIGGLGMELKQQRGFDQLQRTLTTYAQGQIKYTQNQMLFQQGQNKFMEALTNKAAKETAVAQTEAFNRDLSKVHTNLFSALALPQGDKQKEAIRTAVDGAIPLLDKAVAQGTINADGLKSHLKTLEGFVTDAAASSKTKTWGGWGPDVTVQLKGDAKAKAEAAARQEFGKMVQRRQEGLVHLQDAVEQLHTLSTKKDERAHLTNYLSTNMPSLLESKGYQKLPDAEKAKQRSQAVLNMIKSYRAGTLK